MSRDAAMMMRRIRNRNSPRTSDTPTRTPAAASRRPRITISCTVNITASRVSWKKERTMRIFQPDAYILLDLIEGKLAITRKQLDAGLRQLTEEGAAQVFYTSGGGETQQAVISGSADIGVSPGTLGVLGAFAKGAPIRIISGSATGKS